MVYSEFFISIFRNKRTRTYNFLLFNLKRIALFKNVSVLKEIGQTEGQTAEDFKPSQENIFRTHLDRYEISHMPSHWKAEREVGDAPSLGVFKTRLDEALSNLI